jgi:CRP-like cAMP-binding protein
MASGQDTGPRNRLLQVLRPTHAGWIDDLESVPLKLHQVLIAAGGDIEHVYFIEQGVVSVLASPGGDRVELGMIGREGIVGAAAAFGIWRSPHQFLCQGDGEALRISATALAAATKADLQMAQLFGRYLAFMAVQAGQTAYANATLKIESRLARWLLLLHDRMDGFELTVTHDLLAAMLGVRRQGVTMALHVLEGAGMIRAERGRITVLSRKKLKACAGAAYGVAEAEYEHLIRADDQSPG